MQNILNKAKAKNPYPTDIFTEPTKEKETEKVYEIIYNAKNHMDEDPHLANYILRDLKIIKDAGLSDLSWSMHKEGCVKEDVEYLISQLEKYLQEDGEETNN